ncbi:MAG: hypothetical protein JWM19_7147 [Actinomycetia bacterium]|nr:hypothetical protein [Actinomycetes bacterium]
MVTVACLGLAGPAALAVPGAVSAVGAASAVASPAASGIGGSWGKVEAVPGWAALKTVSGSATTISCASAGNCLLVGSYETTVKRNEAFADLEVNGKWTNSGEIPGYAALNKNAPSGYTGSAVSVSCPSAGNCAVTGYFSDKSDVVHGFVADLTGGKKWRTQEIPYLATLNAQNGLTISKVSCASAGNCAVVGGYKAANGDTEPFVSLEYAGVWQDADSVLVSSAFNQGGNGIATAVSCPAANRCVIGGETTDASDRTQSWIAYQNSPNSWGEFEPNGTAGVKNDPSNGAGVTGISCYSAGNCAVVGSYPGTTYDLPYVINENSGVWDKSAMTVSFAKLSPNASAQLTAVSCPSASECAAVGTYGDATPFTVDEIRGSWGPAIALPSYGIGANPYAVSCGVPGDCAASGVYAVKSAATTTLQPFVADELGYGWHGAGQITGLATLNTGHLGIAVSVSCSSPGNCAAVGYYEHGSTMTPFIAERKWTDPTATRIALAPASVAYGHETTVKITITVSASVYVAPGPVRVKAGSTVLCTTWLRYVANVDTISCTLTAKKLPVGSYQVSAAYLGFPGYATSVSGWKKLTITH